jgi:hypothetical protein
MDWQCGSSGRAGREGGRREGEKEKGREGGRGGREEKGRPQRNKEEPGGISNGERQALMEESLQTVIL